MGTGYVLLEGSDMAKVTIMMTIEGQSDAELSQNLFDDVINYGTISHFHDAVKWCAKANDDDDQMATTAKMIYEHHDMWGGIMRDCKWTFKRERVI